MTRKEIETIFKKECEILIREGELIGEWCNVYDHCITEAIVAYNLSKLLKMNEDQSKKLISAAILHDWYKKIERTKLNYNDSPNESKSKLLSLNIDEYVIDLTNCVGHTSLLEVSKTNDFLKRIIHFIDDIVKNDEIVELNERIDYLESLERYKELNESGRIIHDGKTYFEVQRELGNKIQNEIEKILNIPSGSLISILKKLMN